MGNAEKEKQRGSDRWSEEREGRKERGERVRREE